MYEEECGLEEDFFAADGNGPEEGLVVDSNTPEWDPRKYWLRNVEIRVRMALQQWRFLVFSIEESVQDWKDKHRISRSADTGNGNRSELEELFEWTIETMQLLRKLNERFAKTNQLWARFNAHDGDRGYFADMRDARVICMLSSLKNSFEEMSDLKKKLSQLKKSCNESQRLLSLHLEHDSNLANSETREFSRQAQGYNLKTVRMSHSMYKLNRKSTEATEATTHTTRINVQLFLITTPFFLALQYFGAEKDIFSFDRSPKTFGITCAILLCALPLAMCILGYANKFWYEYIRRESRRNMDDDDEGCDKVDV
ncbi:uncharacterized protein EKO05_0008361 [Ascochyta rabiei]|nr:uncharacterized protein EKO05_0008361 [Ascochyta rabiei]UPX18038.1 hypothetical protein EKO05_0008361 [Ascochyta rabiei]